MSNSKEDEELRLLYQTRIDDIRYSKQQQWNTVYLALIAIGGILALLLGLPLQQVLSQKLTIFLTAICIIVCLAGIGFIGVYQYSIARYRFVIEQITQTFTSKTKEVYGKEPKSCELLKRFFAKDLLLFLLVFWVTIILAGAVPPATSIAMDTQIS